MIDEEKAREKILEWSVVIAAITLTLFLVALAFAVAYSVVHWAIS